jgi:arylsulfatase A-like enzyme
MKFYVLISFIFLSTVSCQTKEDNALPNILWIVSEDNSPFLGCYGDSFATSPNIDQFAKEGVLYTNAIANAPVCAPARSTIASGMYPNSMGTENMRSTYNIRSFIKFYPQYLKEAGYYTSNNFKEDYNMPKPDGLWDDSSKNAHYKNRPKNKPFFAVFNIELSHEGRNHISKKKENLRHDPAKVQLPPYHPDTPEMRHDWAQYYDKIEDMDKKVGQILKELDSLGLSENTIVAYYSDHGGVLARSKRFIYESGTRVPMIWRFPNKYKHLAPAKPNSKVDRLVSFVDLAPTLLSLAGVKVPDYMQGKPFLGSQTPKEEVKYVHMFKGRMDERIDMVRAVRDTQFKYIKNYMPHRISGQHIEYLWKSPSCRSWEKAYKNGLCNANQSAFWQTKPTEELYDIQKDPWEVNNLADNLEFKVVLERFKAENKRWMIDIVDTGFIPESVKLNISQNDTIYNVVRSGSYPIEKIIKVADLASEGNPKNLEKLLTDLQDDNPFVRYWAAIGCLILKENATNATNALEKVLEDEFIDTRIVAAESLCHLGKYTLAAPTYLEALESENRMVRLHAVNSLQAVHSFVNTQEIKEGLNKMIARYCKKPNQYECRAVRYLLETYNY